MVYFLAVLYIMGIRSLQEGRGGLYIPAQVQKLRGGGGGGGGGKGGQHESFTS